MVSKAAELFGASVSPSDARIEQLPPIILVFGAQLQDASKSARATFMNWLQINRHPLLNFVKTPEDFEDWNNFQGYSNLVDFEIDAGNLTRAVVLFCESHGACAELGSFCMESSLSERLFIVISRENYQAPSFIAHGPIKKIELQHPNQNSICVLETLEPAVMQHAIAELIEALEDKIRSFPKTQAFQHSRSRDQFLIVADLVDLFGALTIYELHELIKIMQVEINFEKLEKILNQLQRFNFLTPIQSLTKKYFVAPENRMSYINYASLGGARRFDRASFKITKITPWLEGDKNRLRAYQQVHPKV